MPKLIPGIVDDVTKDILAFASYHDKTALKLVSKGIADNIPNIYNMLEETKFTNPEQWDIIYSKHTTQIETVLDRMDDKDYGDGDYRYQRSLVFYMDSIVDTRINDTGAYRVYFTPRVDLTRSDSIDKYADYLDILECHPARDVDYIECHGEKCRIAVWDQGGKYDEDPEQYHRGIAHGTHYHCLSCEGEIDCASTLGTIMNRIGIWEIPRQNIILIEKL